MFNIWCAYAGGKFIRVKRRYTDFHQFERELQSELGAIGANLDIFLQSLLGQNVADYSLCFHRFLSERQMLRALTRLSGGVCRISRARGFAGFEPPPFDAEAATPWTAGGAKPAGAAPAAAAGAGALGGSGGPGQPRWPDNQPGPKVFASYDIYKGSGALQLKPLPPTMRPLEGGSSAVEKPGVVLAYFAPSLGGAKGRPQAGVPRYDWSTTKREGGESTIFALGMADISSILGSRGAGVDLIHNPFAGSATAASTDLKKTFQISPGERGGYFFSMAVMKGGKSTRVSVPLDDGEYAVVTALLGYSVPRLLGWDAALTV